MTPTRRQTITEAGAAFVAWWLEHPQYSFAAAARRFGQPDRRGRPRADYDRQKAREMRAAGASYGEIARALGVPRSTIVGWMRE